MQFNQITIVEDRLNALAKMYSAELSVSETISSVTRLCMIAMADFRDMFKELDDRISKIIAFLQSVAAQVKFIRQQRDALHRRFWAWHDLAEKWRMQPAMHSPSAEKLLQETYRFLAQRYLPQQEWELFFSTKSQKTGQSSEKVW